MYIWCMSTTIETDIVAFQTYYINQIYYFIYMMYINFTHVLNYISRNYR